MAQSHVIATPQARGTFALVTRDVAARHRVDVAIAVALLAAASRAPAGTIFRATSRPTGRPARRGTRTTIRTAARFGRPNVTFPGVDARARRDSCRSSIRPQRLPRGAFCARLPYDVAARVLVGDSAGDLALGLVAAVTLRRQGAIDAGVRSSGSACSRDRDSARSRATWHSGKSRCRHFSERRSSSITGERSLAGGDDLAPALRSRSRTSRSD